MPQIEVRCKQETFGKEEMETCPRQGELMHFPVRGYYKVISVVHCYGKVVIIVKRYGIEKEDSVRYPLVELLDTLTNPYKINL